ncbi:MAG TPA: hypothetical protein VI759_07900 [Dehalococcoidia bacterium]|nr:hypothetical protein [Dehalococcoidia bacterium]
MAEVFGGFVSGYILALLSTAPVAVGIFRLRAHNDLLARVVPEASVIQFSVVLHGALFLFWTLIGLVLGLVLLAMNDSDGALGSANAPFTLFVAALTLAVVAPLFAVVAPARRYILAAALIVLLTFGWLMPWLAEWSTFE